MGKQIVKWLLGEIVCQTIGDFILDYWGVSLAILGPLFLFALAYEWRESLDSSDNG